MNLAKSFLDKEDIDKWKKEKCNKGNYPITKVGEDFKIKSVGEKEYKISFCSFEKENKIKFKEFLRFLECVDNAFLSGYVEKIHKWGLNLETILFLNENDYDGHIFTKDGPTINKDDKIKYIKGFYTITDWYDDIKIKSLKTLDKEKIIRRLANVMQYVHSKEIMHREIVLKNIKKSGDNFVLCGWNSSRFESKTGDATNKPGDEKWKAPEMKDGEYDKKVDVYAFGYLIMQLVSKKEEISIEDFKNAAKEESTKNTSSSDNEEQQPSLSLREIAIKCVEENPDDRLSFSDICNELDKHDYLFDEGDKEKVKEINEEIKKMKSDIQKDKKIDIRDTSNFEKESICENIVDDIEFLAKVAEFNFEAKFQLAKKFEEMNTAESLFKAYLLFYKCFLFGITKRDIINVLKKLKEKNIDLFNRLSDFNKEILRIIDEKKLKITDEERSLLKGEEKNM